MKWAYEFVWPKIVPGGVVRSGDVDDDAFLEVSLAKPQTPILTPKPPDGRERSDPDATLCLLKPHGRPVTAAGRVLGTFAAALGVLLCSSLAGTPGVPLALLAATTAFGVIAACWPMPALLILTAVIPVVGFLSGYIGLPVPWTEPMAVAALTGWSIRVALGFGPPNLPTALRRPWVLFGLLIGASLTVELAVRQVFIFPRPLVEFLRTGYFVDRTAYPEMAAALLLLEGLALFAWVANATADENRWRQMAAMTAFGGAMAALLNLYRFLEIVLRAALPPSAWLERASTLRLNVTQADVNAAGSYFVLVLFLLAGLTDARRWRSLLVLSACGMVVSALWLTGSRTAVTAAALLGGAVLVGIAVRGTEGRRVRLAAGTGALILVMTAAVMHLYSPEKFAGTPAVEALKIRRDMALTSLRMTATRPLFGIGIGRFYDRSSELMPQTTAAQYSHENAHNNFLQVLAELGVSGLAAFTWLLISVLWWRTDQTNQTLNLGRPVAGIRLGLLGFLITCLMGHPLLVREVAYPFWVALGLLAARIPEPSASAATPRRAWPRTMARVGLVVIAATLPIRAIQQRQSANLEQLAFGVSPWERDAEGRWVRHLGSKATFYVFSAAPLVDIPLRLTTVPVETAVRVLLDGQEADQIVLTDHGWRNLRLVLPQTTTKPFRRIDLHVEGPGASVVMGRVRYPSWNPSTL